MKQYLEILKEVLDEGTWKRPARDNMPRTISRFGITKRFDLSEGFPLVTTKKMFFNGALHELLWFLKGDTNIHYLVKNGVNIWNEDSFRYFKRRLWLLPGIKDVTIEVFLQRVREGLTESKFHYTYGDIGPAYGHQWRNFNGAEPYFHIGKAPEVYPENISKTSLVRGKMKSARMEPLYAVWKGILDRCYDYNHDSFSSYGGKGVYVCDEWLDFYNFKKDAELLPNYSEKLKSLVKYELDKDSSGKKYYSKETCVWMPKEENSKLVLKSNEFTISNGKDTHTFRSVYEMARQLQISPSCLRRICFGERETTKGWKLIKVVDLNKGEDQINNLIQGINQNPESRYHIVSAWNPNQTLLSALAPCHMLFMFNCREIMFKERVEIAKSRGIYYDMPPFISKLTADGIPTHYLDCDMTQRSCDTPLGVPFNIASYALLTMIIAKLTNTVPGEFIWSGKDVHIYENQIDAVYNQLERTPLPLPTMEITGDWDSIEDIKFEDFKLRDYKSHDSIKYPLSTGLILR